MSRAVTRWLVPGVAVLSTALALALSGSFASADRPVAAPASTRARCVRYRCTILTADAKVQIFRARNRHPARELPYESSFARWLPTGRVTALGDRFEGRDLGASALSGRFVAAAIEGFAKEPPSSWTIHRLDASTGRAEVVSAVPPIQDQFGEGSPGVTDICVTSAGSIAWIVAPTAGVPGLWRVFELAPSSSVLQELASGPAIVRGSLACVPGHVYWLEGSVARGASIR
jgi:hypothetical protein